MLAAHPGRREWTQPPQPPQPSTQAHPQAPAQGRPEPSSASATGEAARRSIGTGGGPPRRAVLPKLASGVPHSLALCRTGAYAAHMAALPGVGAGAGAAGGQAQSAAASRCVPAGAWRWPAWKRQRRPRPSTPRAGVAPHLTHIAHTTSPPRTPLSVARAAAALVWDLPVNDHPPPLGVFETEAFVRRFKRDPVAPPPHG